jgi:hypothetical protein
VVGCKRGIHISAINKFNFVLEANSDSPSFLFFFFFVFFFFFRDRVSLCSLGCPGTHFVDQAGLELRNPPASASQVLGLKACATTPGLILFFFKRNVLN